MALMFVTGLGLTFRDLDSLLYREKVSLERSIRAASALMPTDRLLDSLETKNSQSPSDSQLLEALRQVRQELGIPGELSIIKRDGSDFVTLVSTRSDIHKGERYPVSSERRDSLVGELTSARSLQWRSGSPVMEAESPLRFGANGEAAAFLVLESSMGPLLWELALFALHGLIMMLLFAGGAFFILKKMQATKITPSLATDHIFTESPQALFVIDQKGMILKANPAAGELLKRPAQSLLRENFFQPSPDVKLISTTITPEVLLKAEYRIDGRFKISLPQDAFRYARFFCIPLDKDAGEFLLSLDDITREVVREQESKRLKEQVITDPLTKTLNKNYLHHFLDPKNIHWIGAEGCSMLMIDLDNFKAVNDSKGHLFGDSLLQNFGLFLRNFFRKSDKVIRYGGDEFIVLLPGTQIPEAKRIGDNFLAALRKTPFDDGIILTASVGVSQLTPDEPGRDWLQRADEAMYLAKKSGKNAVQIAEAPSLEILQ